MTDQEMAMVNLLGLVLFITVVIIIIRFAVGKGVEDANRKTAPHQAPKVVEDEGPGKYEITGVDVGSKMDTTWVCRAESKANAVVKAKLEGIEVTGIKRIS